MSIIQKYFSGICKFDQHNMHSQLHLIYEMSYSWKGLVPRLPIQLDI